ncbi:MAG: cyclic pyranopterin monophosphate synthase MoaC [Eubacterium sp.]|nr:cyclic pyranopterin monophosphate synthase MoaC [Eubacterium sp.]
MSKLTHVDESGKANMVDVSDKEVTRRVALASGCISVSKEVINAILNNQVQKGDVLSTARIAGIMGAKKTSELIPLCHNLFLTDVKIDFDIDETDNKIFCQCSVTLDGKTGAEMEALQGVSISLLTIYDMCKAIDKTMVISEIRLEEKTGGKSGHYKRG